jgi:hypothetical protein
LAILGLILLTSVVPLDILDIVLEFTIFLSAVLVLPLEVLLPTVGGFWKPAGYYKN